VSYKSSAVARWVTVTTIDMGRKESEAAVPGVPLSRAVELGFHLAQISKSFFTLIFKVFRLKCEFTGLLKVVFAVKM